MSSRLSKVHLQEDDFERTPTQKIKRFLYLRKKMRVPMLEGSDGYAIPTIWLT